MPGNASWGESFRFLIAATISAMVGAQIVHAYYKPLDDLEKLVQKELEARRKETRTTQSKNTT